MWILQNIISIQHPNAKLEKVLGNAFPLDYVTMVECPLLRFTYSISRNATITQTIFIHT